MTITSYIRCLFALTCILGTFSAVTQATSDSVPRNVILVIGDGMGLAQISTHIYSLNTPSALEQFPVVGLQKTHSYSHIVTDSGASGTAMACGVKTYNSAIGVTADTVPCENLFSFAHNAGKATGIIVTSSLVHATPAAFVAHEPLRGFRERIAADYLDMDLDYIVGGGLMYFTNRYADDRDLWKEFVDRGYTVSSYEKSTFRKFAQGRNARSVFFTAWDDPLPAFQGRVYYPYAVEHALTSLENVAENGFFLVIEASQIDFAGHSNDLGYLLSEMQDFEKGLGKILEFAANNGETLVVVTGDHATGGLFIADGKPGGRVKAEFTTKNHTAELVPVFALGPNAEKFAGIYDNTEIFYKLRAAGKF